MIKRIQKTVTFDKIKTVIRGGGFKVSEVHGFYKFSVKLWDLILGNFLFLLSNIPGLALLFFVKMNQPVVILASIYIALLFVWPAFSALIYTYSNRYKRENIFKSYWTGYKKSAKQSFQMGAIMNLIFIILFSDYLYFSKISGMLGILFLIVMLICLVVTFAYTVIISNFNFSLSQIFQLIVKFFLPLSKTSLLTLGFLFAFLLMYLTGANFILLVMFGFVGKIAVSSSKQVRHDIFKYHTNEGRKAEGIV
ncbi:hypothetical protein CBF33_04365 [Vagococcus lutrae]|nr:hypothetical protein CBF33_04365 [Vagococcus lutrae]